MSIMLQVLWIIDGKLGEKYFKLVDKLGYNARNFLDGEAKNPRTVEWQLC